MQKNAKSKKTFSIVIYNIKCMKNYITSRFSKPGSVKELQGGCEFNEKLKIH